MRYFGKLLIRRKLMLIMVLVSGVTLVLATCAWLYHDATSFRRAVVEDASAMCEFVGADNATAVLAGDAASAEASLAALSTHERIRAAHVYGAGGDVLARYLRPGESPVLEPPVLRAAGHYFLPSELVVYQPIRWGDDVVGTACLQVDTRFVGERMWALAGTIGGVFAVSSVVTLLLSYLLQRVISRPILELAQAARSVSSDGDYSVRATKVNDDELGFLTEAFNDMLSQIQDRDASLERHRETLEEQVVERTRELSAAVEATGRATAAKSEFLAMMSHEIRTPMNGVIGVTELLMETPLNEQQQSYADMVKGSAESLLAIINDILDFSKVEAGKLVIEEIALDPWACIEEPAVLVSKAAQKKGLDVVMEISPELPSTLVGDPTRLRQILTNLVGNAVKFTERGRVAVRAGVLKENHESVQVRVVVEDTGIGIPAERIGDLFQSFSQADSSTTRRYGGTGLGLAICKHLCELMNGRIGVESTIGVGSRFWIELPFGRDGTARRRDAGVAGRSALVAERSRPARAALGRQLHAWGVGVRHLAEPIHLVRSVTKMMARGETAHVVFVDATFLTHASVRAAVTRLRAAGTTVVGTALAEHSVYDRGAVDRHLEKPLRPSQVHDVLRGLTSEGRGHDSGGFAPPAALPSVGDDARRRLRIVLAEDNPVNQFVGVRILAKRGYRCEVVENGRQALDAFHARRVDVILMDCRMPEMDGYQATREIREWERAHGGERVHIVALTANAMEGDAERCLEAGMDDFVSKPVDAELLLSKLDALAATRRRPRRTA